MEGGECGVGWGPECGVGVPRLVDESVDGLFERLPSDLLIIPRILVLGVDHRLPAAGMSERIGGEENQTVKLGEGGHEGPNKRRRLSARARQGQQGSACLVKYFGETGLSTS